MGAGQIVAPGALLVIVVLITVATLRWHKRNARPRGSSRSRSTATSPPAPTPAPPKPKPATPLRLSLVDADDLHEKLAEHAQARRQRKPQGWLNTDDEAPPRRISRAKKTGIWAAGGSLGLDGTHGAGGGCGGGHGGSCGGGGCGGAGCGGGGCGGGN